MNSNYYYNNHPNSPYVKVESDGEANNSNPNATAEPTGTLPSLYHTLPLSTASDARGSTTEGNWSNPNNGNNVSNALPHLHHQPQMQQQHQQQQQQQQQHDHQRPDLNRPRSWEEEGRKSNGSKDGPSWAWDYNNSGQQQQHMAAPHRFPLPQLASATSSLNGSGGNGLRRMGDSLPLLPQSHNQPHTSLSLRESYDRHQHEQQQQHQQHQQQQQQHHQQMLQQNLHGQQRQQQDHRPMMMVNNDSRQRDRSPMANDDDLYAQQDNDDQLSGSDRKPRRQRRRNGEPPRDLALRKYSCLLCIEEPRAFARPSALKIHMVRASFAPAIVLLTTCRWSQLTHTKEKPHVCPICTRAFAISSNLKRHQRLHEVEPSSSNAIPASPSPPSPLPTFPGTSKKELLDPRGPRPDMGGSSLNLGQTTLLSNDRSGGPDHDQGNRSHSGSNRAEGDWANVNRKLDHNPHPSSYQAPRDYSVQPAPLHPYNDNVDSTSTNDLERGYLRVNAVHNQHQQQQITRQQSQNEQERY